MYYVPWENQLWEGRVHEVTIWYLKIHNFTFDFEWHVENIDSLPLWIRLLALEEVWKLDLKKGRDTYWLLNKTKSHFKWDVEVLNMFPLSTNELQLYFLSYSDYCPKYPRVLVEVDAITFRIGLKKTITILGLVIVHLWWPISQTRNNLKPKSHLISSAGKAKWRREGVDRMEL